MSLTLRYFAHTGFQTDCSDWQPLALHLLRVAEGAEARAREACPADGLLIAAARAAGLLHDLGKYRPEFQQMLLCEVQRRPLPFSRELTYHKEVGAAHAAKAGHAPIAWAIAGHHGGLPDRVSVKALLEPKFQDLVQAVWSSAIADCPVIASLSMSPPVLQHLEGELATRLVFSCLVDADWADTAEYERQLRRLPIEPAPAPLDAAGWLAQVLAYIGRRAAQCQKNAPVVAGVRQEVLEACLQAAELAPGLFRLTVPTGGGKTLSGLAFALKHAATHGLRRVIYVAPYLSILDQNARVIREAMGFARDAPEVLEHHSLAEPGGDETEDVTRREAAARRAENWDAPVVLTTNVQFFESLFANKPGRCRKLHNIARSVVLLDECQTLPPDLVAPSCSMLGQLAAQLGCTLVFCTATQPAFDHADMPERLTGVREIIPTRLNLFSRLSRVCASWPGRDEVLDWPAVADRMCAEGSALCIVNTRRAARDLFHELRRRVGEDAFHLSTSMCPAHRLEVLDRVQKRLDEGQPCCLVSTQLIEAGVDIDFPFVLRELAPLEAILQAAGRCNREGKRNGPDGTPGGKVLVFRSAEGRMPPDRWYHAGRGVVETSFLNAGREPRLEEPEDIREYFQRLYRTGDLDAHKIQASRLRGDFREVAGSYRLIDDDGEPVVIATWQERAEEIAELLADLRQRPTRSVYRRLSRFSVNVRRDELGALSVTIAEEVSGLFVWRGAYDPHLGLTANNADQLLLV
jgi:CRISPR-associated endonuclease/helicase Cas3